MTPFEISGENVPGEGLGATPSKSRKKLDCCCWDRSDDIDMHKSWDQICVKLQLRAGYV